MLNPTELKYVLYDSYYDMNGQVTVDKDPTTPGTTNDGHMLTGYAHSMMGALDILNNTDRIHYMDMIEKCELESGKYARYPGSTHEASHDQLVGIDSGAVVHKLEYTTDIEQYALKHLFVWNIDGDLTWGDFLGRMVFHMMYLLLCTGKLRYLPLLPIVLVRHLLVVPESYKIILTYMQVETLARLYRPYRMLRNFLVKRLKLEEETARFCKTEAHPLVGLARHVKAIS